MNKEEVLVKSRKLQAQWTYEFDPPGQSRFQKIKYWISEKLRKLGPARRKKILEFLGWWTVEDEIFDILAEEITNEIDKELIEKLGKPCETCGLPSPGCGQCTF